MRLNLFFLVPSTQLGGCTSFTVHLYKAFEQLGYAPTLWRIGNGADSKPGVFPYGLRLWTCSQQTACTLAANEPSIIVYCFWRKQGERAKPLIDLNVPMVVHDPAEFRDDSLEYMRARAYSPLVIRKANVAGLAQCGITARYVPHPYVPIDVTRAAHFTHALCLARIDFRKRTHMIVEANARLSPSKAVHLYGEINRLYEFHLLRKKFPDWRQWYHGEFPAVFGQAARMFSLASYAVDLTQIRGDGGGTQYTFFEAWNAGVPLVLNRAWETCGDDEVRDGDSCVMVSSADELVRVLDAPQERYARCVEGGTRVMRAHGADVAQQYLAAMLAR